MQIGSRTNTAEALRYVGTNVFRERLGDRKGIPNVIVLVVDSNDRRQDDDTREAAEELKRAGVQVR